MAAPVAAVAGWREGWVTLVFMGVIAVTPAGRDAFQVTTSSGLWELLQPGNVVVIDPTWLRVQAVNATPRPVLVMVS